jgi:hypothetical protein
MLNMIETSSFQPTFAWNIMLPIKRREKKITDISDCFYLLMFLQAQARYRHL